MSETPSTITDVAPRLRRGERTPVDLVQQCFERIDRYEAKVHAWAYLDRDRAMDDARKLTEELRAGQDRGPLHGIPVGIKDIIDVFDMPTGCGSKLWANSYARKDATCVARLRSAGAIILGKTVTTPFAYLDPPPTRNPWNLDRTPGGSSSGSAAAVACGMCLAALGTQTGGSVTRPASFCGVYSLKPTHGRISTEGVLPLAPSLDHIGVMANCVRDLAIVFQAIAGYDPAAFTISLAVPDCVSAIDSHVASIDKTSLNEPQHRKRFSIPSELLSERLHPEMLQFMNKIERDFRSLAHADAAVQRISFPPEFKDVHRLHRLRMAAGAAVTHQNRFARHPEDYPQRIRELILEGKSASADQLSIADSCAMNIGAELVGPYRSDVIVTPAALGPAPTPETTGDAWCNSPWSFTGMPTVSLPLGWSNEGLPLGVQLVGAHHREDWLFAQAAWVAEVFRRDGAYKPRPIPL